MDQRWSAAVTVAAIIARQAGGQIEFLLIEEETDDGLRLNQPAGHLDPDETLLDAVVRETLEEAAHDFTPTALVGTYLSRWTSPLTGESSTYLRFAFCGDVGKQHQRPLDKGILRFLWVSEAEIRASQTRHRSPLVLQCVEDYLKGQRAPLELIFCHPSALGR